MSIHRRNLALMLICGFFVILSSAGAQSVLPGIDSWGSVSGLNYQDFSADPIPADFFDPGSLPWDGTMVFRGEPIDPPYLADTLVERPLGADLDCGGYATYTPLRIFDLHLMVIEPIEVEYGDGTSELWEADAIVLQEMQRDGYAVFRKYCPAGGTMSVYLPVVPRLRFRRMSDGAIRKLTGEEIIFESTDMGWVYDSWLTELAYEAPAGTVLDTDGDGVPDTAVGTSNITPGIDMSPCTCAVPPKYQTVRPATYALAPNAQHAVRPVTWPLQ